MISFSQTDYYYYKGEKIYLTKNYQYVNIVTANIFDETQLNSVGVQPFTLRTETKMRNGEYKKYSKIEFTSIPNNQNDYIQKITELKNLINVEGVYPFYDYNGSIIGVSNYITIRLKQLTDLTILETIASQKNIDIDYQIPNMPYWYQLSLNTTTIENVIQLCKEIYELDLFEQVEPVFTGNITTYPFDINATSSENFQLEDCLNYNEGSIEAQQWNLFNNSDPNGNPLADINVCDAWNITKGYRASIAVLDTGIYAGIDDFPTLQDVIETSGPFDENYYYTEGGTGASAHGTYVSGIIAALHDGDNAGGIAPEASMLYVANKLSSTFNQNEIAAAISYIRVNHNEVGVLNMSFGNTGPTVGILKDAIDSALVYGHYGYGIVLVAGSGNEPGTSILQPANHSGVLAVGGTTEDGEANGAYTHGFGLDVVAGSTDIPTVTQFGEVGVFAGTSAATPHVTGIAALMFAADDPTDDDGFPIKAEAVRNIIRRTAQKSGMVHEYTNILFEDNLGSSNIYMGYGIPDATACVKTAEAFTTDFETLDLHMRNSTNDYGFEPDNVTRHASYVLWNSPDIWIRNNSDYSLEHENPVQGTNVTVFVKIVNKSNTPLTNGAQVVLHWSKLGGFANSWPSYWDGSITLGNNVIIGDIVGTENIPTINPGEQAIVAFNWQVPILSDFTGITTDSDGNDINLEDFSLVARIVSNDDQMVSDLTPYIDSNGNAFGNVWLNAKNNNNFVWKNVEVVNAEPNPKPGTITIINNTNYIKEYSLEFVVDDNPVGNVIFEEAEVKIQMDTNLFQDWATKGSVKANFEITNQEFKVSEDDAIIDNISLEAGEIRTLPITFNFLADEVSNKKEFTYHYIQRDKVTGDIVYGKTFYIKKGESTPFDADAGNDKEIDKNQSVTLSATTIDDPATYNWYDPEGNLIYTGQDFTLSPAYTKQYTLEIIKDADGLKDYDTVTIEVNPFVLGTMSPNPATNQVTINYIAEDASSAYFMLTAQNTGNTYNHIIDTQTVQKAIDVSSYPTGIYLVSLICDGNLVETKQLIIN